MQKICGFTLSLVLIAILSFGVSADSGPKKLVIQKYPGNYTCFLFQFPSGTVVVTDPYNIDDEVRADIVTESHNHLDHTDISRIKTPYRLINTCGRFDVNGIKITGFPGHHNKGDQEISNIIYVIEADGFRIAQFASQGDVPGPSVLAEIGKVDVLIIQSYTYVSYKLNPGEVKRLADQLNPKIVIPAHGDDSYTIRGELAKLLNGGASLSVPDGRLEIDEKKLESIKPSQVVIMNH